jgi:hypothetical protein
MEVPCSDGKMMKALQTQKINDLAEAQWFCNAVFNTLRKNRVRGPKCPDCALLYSKFDSWFHLRRVTDAQKDDQFRYR